MKWNREKLLMAANGAAKAVGARDFEGDTAAELVTYLKSIAEKCDVPGLLEGGELVDEPGVVAAFGRKKVVVSYDSTVDTIEINDTAEGGEVMEEAMEGDDSEEDQVAKAFKAYQKAAAKANGGKLPDHLAKSARDQQKGGGSRLSPAGYDRMASRKRYDAKAARGETSYSSSDALEVVNAWARLNWLSGSAKHANYQWRKYDEDILTKAGSTFDNTLGGFLVPDGVSQEIIELKAHYGVARRLAGFESMPLPKWDVNRFGDDVTVYKSSEGSAMTASDMTFSQVTLISEEITAYSVMSNRLINLSPIDMGDAFSRSAFRGFGKFEDDSFFNSANGFEGLSSKVGANSTLDVTGLTAWSGITLDNLLAWKSLLPAYVDNYTVDEIPITCSRPVFDQVFRKYALAQGGSNTDDMLNAGELRFDGHPIILNNSTARTFANNAIAAYIGPFKAVTKVGELVGANRVDSSTERHFDSNSTAMRAIEEFAINCHDVNNTNDSDGFNTSGVVALQVGT